jgi:hypothetical protein
MIDQFSKKKMQQHLENCHVSAMAFIEIVTNTAINQAHSEGRTFLPEEITPETIGLYAARKTGLDAEQLIKDYTDMMVLEGMVEIVEEIHHLPEGS